MLPAFPFQKCAEWTPRELWDDGGGGGLSNRCKRLAHPLELLRKLLKRCSAVHELISSVALLLWFCLCSRTSGNRRSSLTLPYSSYNYTFIFTKGLHNLTVRVITILFFKKSLQNLTVRVVTILFFKKSLHNFTVHVIAPLFLQEVYTRVSDKRAA
jgi:hypothetical protein